MTKRLILIRHAKSSWDAPFDDHSRTLDERGRAAATVIGEWLATQGYVPDAILSSDAARTVETTERLVTAMKAKPKIEYVAKLYHGTPAALWTALRGVQGDTVAVVAHNPGIAFFAEDVVADAPEHRRFLDYPTGATLVCDFPTNNWAEAVSRSGQVVDFVVPKDL